MSKRIFNRVYHRDQRDDAYILTAKKSPRTQRYWREGVILDQGDTPSCVGHAWAGWLKMPPSTGYLDPVGLYQMCQYRDEWEGEDYEGTSIRAGADVLKSLGFIKSYRWARKIDAVVYALLEQGPLVVGTTFYSGMDNAGVVSIDGENCGGHAYRLTGINTKSGLIRWTNSWGREFGDNGHAWITIDDFAELMKDEGEVALAIETKPVPSAKAAA